MNSKEFEKLLFMEGFCLSLGEALSRFIKGSGMDVEQFAVETGRSVRWIRNKLEDPGSLKVHELAELLYALRRRSLLVRVDM